VRIELSDWFIGATYVCAVKYSVCIVLRGILLFVSTPDAFVFVHASPCVGHVLANDNPVLEKNVVIPESSS
jgi:hypothetical protein